MITKESEYDVLLPRQDEPKRVYPLPIYLGWLKEDLIKKDTPAVRKDIPASSPN